MATTTDGVNLNYPADTPLLAPRSDNEYEVRGVEDPRITFINGVYYIVYVGASIDASTVMTGQISWRTRISLATTQNFEYIDQQGVILEDYNDKDAALLPVQIDNHFYLYHRRMPSIWLSKTLDFQTWEDVCKHDCQIVEPNAQSWDSDRIGVGSQPLPCELGWLNFYHGRDKTGVYRLGALVFDYNHPEKILFKLPYPVLEPLLPFEQKGQIPNVVFSCGAVEAGGNYWVYYGGADSSIGAGTIGVKELMEELKKFPLRL